MGTIMLLFIAIILVVPALCVPTNPQPGQGAIVEVCKILQKNINDQIMCFDKAKNFIIEDRESASISYLCCLGFFDDVQKSYKNAITLDMLMHIIDTRDPNEAVTEAIFIVMCEFRAKLGQNDYFKWRNGRRSIEDCKAQ